MKSTQDGENIMNKSLNPKIRVGKIKFTNVWPIYYDFNLEQLDKQVSLISQYPTELNQGMAEGRIDMGPISSFAYAENFDKYILFPDLSVSAFGKVNSILLFHKRPLKELTQSRIALPTTSATSVNLLKIIMSIFYSGDPEFVYGAPILKEMMLDADAALLIGDDAIQANWSDHPYQVTDLGELWTTLTGQWMSFAVWAVRKETLSLYPQLVEKVFNAFQQSKQKGLSYPIRMIQEAQATVGGTSDYWHEYFSHLCYDFGAKQRKGLDLYYHYALEAGLINKEVSIQIWTNKIVV